jgi:transposase-like protein
MQECGQFGAAIAGGALRHDINANMVHRWWREHSGTSLVAHLCV